MRACKVCGRSVEDDLYCGRCEKIVGNVMLDLKAELEV